MRYLSYKDKQGRISDILKITVQGNPLIMAWCSEICKIILIKILSYTWEPFLC